MAVASKDAALPEEQHVMPSEEEEAKTSSANKLKANPDSFSSSDINDLGSDSDSEFRGPSEDNDGGHSKNSEPAHFPPNPSSAILPLVHFSLDPVYSRTKGRLSRKDGRLKLSINETANRGFLTKALGNGLSRHLGSHSPLHDSRATHTPTRRKRTESDLRDPHRRPQDIPKLNIVIMVIGSRGDIQPFIKVGRILKEQHKHRVRVATHPAFKKFVEEDCGLEFFSAGGDPSELMAYMVKNPGLIPSFETIKHGEIGRRREAMAEMFRGFWRACVEPTDGEEGKTSGETFVADAIISNPPVMCHAHCAERLGCPLHIMFTFPYTPTQSFPHPLANIKKSNVDESYTNFMSYPLVEMFTWQGLGDLVNNFRIETLGLDPVSTLWAPGQLYRLKVPHTYMWSPGLVPKPHDWGPEIDLAGFVFLDLASSFQPPKDLVEFIEAGDAPVYIGFGSIVVDDPDTFTNLIFGAIKKAGVRALVSKGWGGLGAGGNVPENVFLLDNVPHDWLFPRCKAVIHHGGAGTTAIGLKCGIPTMIVPFFGDQPFWGAMVAAAKAGAHECIPYHDLTLDKLSEGIEQCLTENAKANAQRIADSIVKEGDGAANAVDSFHECLPLGDNKPMRCSVLPDRAAVWQMSNSNLRLSSLAGELLVSCGKTSYDKLDLWRTYRWTDFQGPGGPITGAGGALLKSAVGIGKDAVAAPVAVSKDVVDRTQYEKRRYEHEQRKEARRKARGAQGGPTKVTSIVPDLTSTQTEEPGLVDRYLYNMYTASSNTNGQARSNSIEQEQEQEQEPGSLPVNRTETEVSNFSQNNPHKTTAQILHNSVHEVAEPAAAAAKLPMDLFLGVANGFHNLPRLYGDDTVRRPVRIDGLRSSLSAAGREFVLQSFDALTGPLTQPYHGFRQTGLLGAATGFGKGLSGIVMKGSAALTGPPAFILKGIHKELTRHKAPIAQIRASRIAQGRHELASLNEDNRAAALEAAAEGWQFMNEVWQEADRLKRGEIAPDGTELKPPPAWAGGTWAAGLRGQVNYALARRKWEEEGATQDVQTMRRTMELRSKTESFHQALWSKRTKAAATV